MSAPFDHPLDVTLFPRLAADVANARRMTLADLADLAGQRLGATKSDLPLIKLAMFGDRRSPKNSLRHGANMLELSGVEADYDAGVMTIEAAADALRTAGVAAVLYTSPSHTAAKPRWRVLCPFSAMVPVSSRREYLGRLNAVLGGVLADESFTDAQSFYIGETDAAPVTVVRAVGDFLDRVLLPAPVFPLRNQGEKLTLPPMRQDQSANEHVERAVAAVREAFTRRGDIGRHQTLLAATNTISAFVLSGHLSRDEAEQHVIDAMESDGRTPNENEVSGAMAGALQTARPYCPPTGGAEFAASPPPPRHKVFTSRDFRLNAHQGYVVKGLLAPGNVAVLLGSPGAGKSTLAASLAYAVAQGRPFFGLRTRKSRTLIAAAEDANGYEKRLAALGDRFGHTGDCAMVEGDTLRDPAKRTKLLETIADVMPSLVILDTIAAAFAGMEENSSQDMGEVIAFARGIAASGPAVLLLHHPAKVGDGSPRGHSSLNGTLDMVLTLAADDLTDADTVVRGSTGKNRNGSTAYSLAFRKDVIVLGIDDEGDAITTTLPIEVDEAAERRTAPPKLSPNECRGLAAIRASASDREIPEQEAVDICASISTAEKPRDRLRAGRQTFAGLLEKGCIGLSEGFVGVRAGFADGMNAGSTQGIEFVDGISGIVPG